MEQHLPAFIWPRQSSAALACFDAQDIVIIYVEVPENIERDAARQALRLAVTELLVTAFHCPAQKIRISSMFAKGVYALVDGQELFISMSYEVGIAIAAISCKNQIGIDILRVAPEIEWEDLARLYLGAQKATEIRAAPVPNQFRLFATYWTQLESTFKSERITLTEYENQISAANHHLLADAELFSLQVPNAYVASLALSKKV